MYLCSDQTTMNMNTSIMQNALGVSQQECQVRATKVRN